MFTTPPTRRTAFTLVELLVVMAVIAILASIALQLSGVARKKAAMSRARGEIQAMEVACEAYKADNGIYPRGKATGRTTSTDSLNANPAGTAANGNPGSTAYKDTSIFLYGELSGDKNFDGAVNASDDLVNGAVIPKIYMAFKPDQLAWTDQTLKTAPILFLADPWGNSYGYSTAYQKWVDDGSKGNANGYNPTFDLWSTAGSNKPPTTTPATDVTPQWIKNW